jgi:hypothetical protein
VKSKNRDLADLRCGRFHDRLLATAEALLDEADGDDPGVWSAVIVVSGSACDAAAAYALQCYLELDAQRPESRLGARRSRRVRELLRSKKTVNLKPKIQREYWQALTGDRLSRWSDWIRYVRSVERRNAVLHSGSLPSRRAPGFDDAAEALEVARSLHKHLALVMCQDPRLADLV